jgi:hypothetical protein
MKDILEGKYILSLDGEPAEDIRKVLGGPQFGLKMIKDGVGW